MAQKVYLKYEKTLRNSVDFMNLFFFLEEANIVSLSNILQITSYVTTLM